MSGPPPPSDLGSRSPINTSIPAGSILHRFHDGAYGPIFYDRTKRSRFNSPDGSFGVLYAAHNADGAFVETFLRELGKPAIPSDFIHSRGYARLAVTRDLKFLDLHGPGLSRLSATAEVTHSGQPYDIAQAWAKAVHELPEVYDGIAYRSRHDDAELCYAIFNRAASAINVEAAISNLDTKWFWELVDKYNLRIL